MAVEGQHANLGDFFHPKALDIPCLFDLTGYPGVIRKHRGPRGFFLSQFAQINLWGQMESWGILPPLLPPLGSVGIAAVYLARILTGNEILVTGLDFCFQPGKTHSRGAPFHRSRLGQTSRMDPIISFDHGFSPPLSRHINRRGRSVLSSPNLLEYHALLLSLGDGPRIWDIGTCSLPSCLPVPEEPRDLLKNRPPSGGKILGETHSPPTRDAPGAFLDHWGEDLQNLLELGYQWLTGKRDKKTETEINRLLGKHDFLYATFPDAPPPSGLEETFLKRVLAHAGRFQGKIKG